KDERDKKLIVQALIGVGGSGAKAAFDRTREADNPALWLAAVGALADGRNAGAKKVGAELGVPFLLDALKKVPPMARLRVVEQLHVYGPAAKDEIPALKALAQGS